MWLRETPRGTRVCLMLLVCLQPLFLSMSYVVSWSEADRSAVSHGASGKVMAVVEYYSGDKLHIEYYQGSVSIYQRPEFASGEEDLIRIRVPESDTVLRIPLKDIDRFDVTFPRQKDCHEGRSPCVIKCYPKIEITTRNKDRFDGILDTLYSKGELHDRFPGLRFFIGFTMTIVSDDSVYQLDHTSKTVGSSRYAGNPSPLKPNLEERCSEVMSQVHRALRLYAPLIKSCVFEWSEDYPAALEKYKKMARK